MISANENESNGPETAAKNGPSETDLASMFDDLKRLGGEAAKIADVLHQNKPHSASPYIGALRSKATALVEMIDRHSAWLAAQTKK